MENKMKKITILLIINLISFALCNLVFAGTQSKFEFVRDYIQALGLLKSSFVDSTTVLNGTYENEIDKGSAIMQSFTSQRYNLEIAKNLLKQYQNFPDDLIKDITKNTLFAYSQLEDLNKEASINFKRMYSPEVLNNHSQINQGEEMEKIGNMRAAQEQMLELLIDESKLTPAALVSKAIGDNGKMNYLSITLEQKDELLQDLLNDFGNKVKVKKEDFKTSGIQTIDLSGWVIFNTLNSGYKTIEDRPKGFIEPS